MDPYRYYSEDQETYAAEQAVGMGIPSTGLMDTGSDGGYVDTGAFTYQATQPTAPPVPVAQIASPFRFGIEIELVLQGKKKNYKTWYALAEAVSQRLSKAALKNHIEPTDKSKMYKKWSVVPENSIRGLDASKYLYGIELVSPVFPTNSDWWQQMQAIFNRVIPDHFEQAGSNHTATHIHISRDPLLTTEELAALAKFALYYEGALNMLVPPHRQGTDPHWAQSNCGDMNPALRRLPLAQCLLTIDDALNEAVASGQGSTSAASTARTDKRNEPVVKVMNLYDKDSLLGRSGKAKNGEHFIHAKGYKWDFAGMIPSDENIKGSGRGTVEFRQPPGSHSAEDAAIWIVLGCAFVAGAVVVDASHVYPKPDGSGGSLEELEGFLYAGAEHLGWASLWPLDKVIQCAHARTLPWLRAAGMEGQR